MAGKPEIPAQRAPASQRPPLFYPILVVALAVPLLAAAWFAQKWAADIRGPLAIAANDREVAVLASGILYRLDHDGALLATDVDNVADDIRDGGVAYVGGELLVSPGVDGELLHCVDDECKAFTNDNYAPVGPVQSWFDGTYFWFSETEADRIQRYTPDGVRVDMPVSDLAAPGTVWRDGETLVVADSGNHKISRYQLHKRGIGEPEAFAQFTQGPAENPVNAPTRFLPQADGSLLAIFSNATRDQGALVAVSADGDSEPVLIDGLSNPIGIAALGDARLILDEGSMQVFRQTADGNVDLFGDDDFRAQLAEQEALRSGLRVAVPVLFVLAVLMVALGGTWLLQRLTWRPLDPALNVSPDGAGIIWLPAECDLAPTRIPRYLLVAAPLALAPVLAIAFTTTLGAVASLWSLLCFAVAAAIPGMAAMRARLPKGERIGVRDRHLIVTHPERGMREFALPKVEWNEFMLRPEPGMDIPLLRDGVPLYHQSSLEELLLPRLNLMRKLEG